MTSHARCAVAASHLNTAPRSSGSIGPTQIATPTNGRKIAVAAPTDSFVNRSNNPITTGNARYNRQSPRRSLAARSPTSAPPRRTPP